MLFKNTIEVIAVLFFIPWCIFTDAKQLSTWKLLIRYAFTLALIVLCTWMEFNTTKVVLPTLQKGD